MLLVGHFDSPFVRRVGVSMHILGLPFERNLLSVFGDAEAMRAINPLGRIPSLILDDGEVLIDSAAILDHLDEVAGPARALLPASGRPRREALRLIAIATGATDKAIAIAYERLMRPIALRHPPYIERCKTQMLTALAALEAAAPESGCFAGDRIGQSDITIACALAYIRLRTDDIGTLPAHPKLDRFCRMAEAHPALAACLPSPAEIGGPEADARAAIARMRGET